MSASQICIVATIVVYLVAMVLVGVYCSRKGAGGSSHEFYLGGRKLGPCGHSHECRSLAT